ncbi:MaoC family dehydratase [Caulobacter sp. KR2-114]|uniref:MaoC family dehydratase n=1 Tax=Caulobacter sp. KR2-114 TaxID=3400912 RepID=UPI003BFC6ADF
MPSLPLKTVAPLGQGLFWQDMPEGAVFQTYTRTVTEADLINFVTLTGMTDSGFLDVTKVGAMGARPVPGALTYAFVEGFVVQSMIRGTGIAMLSCALETIAPVRVGDTICARIVIDGVRPTSRAGRAIVDSTITVLNQESAPVMRYTSRRMIAGRPEAVEA